MAIHCSAIKILYFTHSFLYILELIINFASESRFYFDSAKIIDNLFIYKRLLKCNAVTLKYAILKMNPLPLQENLKKYTCVDSCPVRNIISHFSGKWSMLILCVLSENEATRFNAIGRAIPDISPKVLTETLKSLESAGLVSRHIYAEIPPKVEYSLTPLGHSLMPHITGLIKWAMENYDLNNLNV